MLCQMYIIDTKVADSALQIAYISNALVNFWGLTFTFYEVDLLLEYHNIEFKRFWADCSSFLQETDEIFQLHLLSVDILVKMRQFMNRIIIGRDRSGGHLTKVALFNIYSLANQL